MKPRKGSVTSAPSPRPSSAIALPPGAAQSKTYVEFHASMSLDNPTSAMSFFAPSSSISGASGPTALSCQHQQLSESSPATYENTTLEHVLRQRFHVWSQVHEVIEALAPVDAYACDVTALKKLQELHHLCNILLHTTQRETHLRTLQLALLHGRNIRGSRKGSEQPPAVAAPTAHATNEATAPVREEPIAPDSAAVLRVEQLVESLEDFGGDDAIDLFQLAM